MGKSGSLSVFGVGPKGPSQLTLEILENMKRCEEIYGNTLFQEAMSAFSLTLDIPFKPTDWGQHFTAAHHTTRPGARSSDSLSKKILKRLKAGVDVGLIVDGHPAFFCFATSLLEECRKKGYACRTYASIGALDQILVTLDAFAGYHLESGVAIYNVLSPSLAKIRLNADSGVFFYNVGQLFKRSSKQFQALFKRLNKEYGGRHRVYLIECTPAKDNVRVCPLQALDDELKFIGVNLTLFVPQRKLPRPQ